ncbi:MAG: thioredoxin family protein [Kiritimatiellae bacterium]|nr:thioredoxin family protein [Kiritimatiellia bacterium]
MWNIFRKKSKSESEPKSISQEQVIASSEAEVRGDLPKLQVLGSIGCVSCKLQFAQMQEALKELGYPQNAVEYVEDIEVALNYGVMSVPAIVIDGKVVASGKVLKKNQLIELLNELKG